MWFEHLILIKITGCLSYLTINSGPKSPLTCIALVVCIVEQPRCPLCTEMNSLRAVVTVLLKVMAWVYLYINKYIGGTGEYAPSGSKESM